MRRTLTDSEQNNPTIEHPLQKFVNRSAPFVGFFAALFILSITFFSIFLVINSAYTIGGFVYLTTLIGSLALFGLQSYLLRFIKNNRLLVRGKKVDQLILWIIPLLIYGFVETFFWVIDSSSPIHEPRSVFILATAGILGFVRSQIETNQRETKSAETTGEVVSQ